MFQAKSPYNTANYCYTTLADPYKVKDYEYTFEKKEDQVKFQSGGAWRKFDQKAFATSAGLGDMKEIRQWGFYYVPTEC